MPVGLTVEVGFVVDSQGKGMIYLSGGIVVGPEISGSVGVIGTSNNMLNKNWLGTAWGVTGNIGPLGGEWSTTMDESYEAWKLGAGLGFGISTNLSHTIKVPAPDRDFWLRPGHC